MKFKNWMESNEMRERTREIVSILTRIFDQSPALLEGKGAQEDTERLWTDNGFLNWLSANGIDVENGKVPPYAQGGVGRAYFVGDMVVKFTDNKVEANVANMLAGIRDSHTRVHSVYKIPGTQVYAILNDKVNMKFPRTLGHAADLFMTYCDIKNLRRVPDSDIDKDKLVDDVLAEFPNEPTAKQYLKPYLKSIIDMHDKFYRRTGYFHTDAMPQNMGMDDKGEIVVTDLGPHVHTGQKSLLSKIHKTRKQLGLPKVRNI
jgi:hypothetical protein